ncbi:DUF6443 domain-containing protein [Mucilaginibacter sp. KACC 22773]|uniref:DUF6443 domain-containing protein n=1 Tax=Mucilaginibacter sp. KACC 22773 TaxID=3025671 RepID=UPI002365B79A|nr:DUF6443 domain-containing protein [Mucilaginibacter sp. KACC 22773]WDF80743.1 DUF6443 domain-containing protein [Mucilaginibacter sp. KACC 22773]
MHDHTTKQANLLNSEFFISLVHRLSRRLHLKVEALLRLFLVMGIIFTVNQAYGQKGTVSPNVVQPTDPPGAPGPISGPIQLQSGASSITATYTTTSASGATGYSWVATDDNVMMSSSGLTGTLTVPANYAGSFTINCYAYNSVGQTGSTYPLGVIVYSPTVSGTISPSSQAANYNSAPSTALTATAATGSNGSFTYQWQSSPDNSNWSVVSGATSLSYSPPALTSTTYYRIVSTGFGSSATSGSVIVTVYPQLTAGTISPATQAINYNTPASLTGGAATGGNGTYAYQWQSSPDNTTFTNISGATGTGYTSGNLTATKYYRRTVTSNGQPLNSNSVTVTVYPQLVAGTISPATQAINYNTPASLTGGAATGGNGTYAYQWQSSPDNTTFTNISGATGVSYTSGSLTATTYYRRTVTSNGQPLNSNSVTVTVYPQLVAGTISPATQAINYNTPASLTGGAATGGNGTYAYQWQSSPDNTTFTNISGATGVSYTSGSLTTTTYYRRTVTSNGQPLNSNSVTVTVYPQLVAGTISPATQAINYNTPASLTGGAATGGNGTYAYQWQSSPDNTTFTNISGATGVSYTSGSLTATTYYRRTVTSNGQPLNSNSVTVTVYPQLTAGTISPATQSISYNATATLTGIAATGGNGTYAYQWQSSPDNTTFTNISGATGTGYTSGTLTATKYYRRAVTSNGVTVNSASATVMVNPQLSAVISPASQMVIPNAAAGVLTCTPSGGNGTFTYQWQISADNITFININTATGSSYNPDVLVSTKYFRVSVTSNGATVNSNVATVTITECVALGSSPSADKNYITMSVPRTQMQTFGTGYSTCDVNQIIQYFDGLGRPLQTVQVKASPSNRDIVVPNVYDPFGREAAKYLPYVATAANSNGSYKSTAIADQASFYNTPGGGTWNAPGVTQIPVSGSITPSFAQTAFEASPLNRVTEQGSAGAAWQPTDGISGHTSKIVYTANDLVAFPATTSGDDGSRKAAYYTVSSTGALTRGTPAFYDAGTLFVTISKDENWQSTNGCFGTVEEYKDKTGHVVLKRTYNLKTVNAVTSAEMLSTYYVYDDLGNLAFVLPPLAGGDMLSGVPAAGVLNNLCYQYKYDQRNRMIQKKIPGKGWEYMVYNRLDQVVLSQDAVQRTSNQWTVMKYDGLGRVIITGLWTDVSAYPQATLQANIYGASQWDVRNTADATTGYTISSYPSITTYLGINYYDDYTFSNITGLPPAFTTAPAGAIALPKGSVTAIKQYVLGATYGLWSVTYYDSFGRVLQTYKQHNLGGGSPNTGNYDVVTNHYDFTNALTSSTRKHYTTAGLAVTITNTYVYDHLGRKKQTYEQINSEANVLLSQQAYNELGQLWTKKQGSEDLGGYFLQKTGYAYNERGWLSKINDPATAPTAQSMFAMQLGYNSGSSPQYNGNISSQQWYTYQQPSSQTFSYTYDAMNRVISGVSGPMSESGISYDQGGNIQALKRDANTAYGYTYIAGTNQLQSVSGLTSVNYAYDPNSGNVTTDGRTGATLTYNLLNLPSTVVKTGTGAFNIAYTYDAAGDKLRKVSGTTTTDYISGIQYDNLSGTHGLDFIQTEEGRASKRTDGTYRYEYDLADHLGNTRVTFYKDPVTLKAVLLQADDYYPFGMRSAAGTPGTNHYLYNKKELQDETGQYDYGARFYDPAIARWTTMDALTEKYYPLSPYNYVTNSPIKITDPDGNDWFRGSDGGIIWNNSKDKAFTQDNMIYSNIGSTLTITTTSYINTPNDLPLPEEVSGAAAGDKLTTSISITGNYKEDGSFSNFTVDYRRTVGATFNAPGLDGVNTPGQLNTQQGSGYLAGSSSGEYSLMIFAHVTTPPIETAGLKVIGKNVDVNQEFVISFGQKRNLNIDLMHGTYPSVSMNVAGVNWYRYQQDSFIRSHATRFWSVTSLQSSNPSLQPFLIRMAQREMRAIDDYQRINERYKETNKIGNTPGSVILNDK